jgi:hypothetical protein
MTDKTGIFCLFFIFTFRGKADTIINIDGLW